MSYTMEELDAAFEVLIKLKHVVDKCPGVDRTTYCDVVAKIYFFRDPAKDTISKTLAFKVVREAALDLKNLGQFNFRRT